MQRLEESYQAVRARFDRACKKCGQPSERLPLPDVPTMAEELMLGAMLFSCYYQPLMHSHPKMAGYIDRVVLHDGGIRPKSRINRDLSDQAMQSAHGLCLIALESIVERWGVGREALKNAERHFLESWSHRQQGVRASDS